MESTRTDRVAYVAWAYPVVTQTFTFHEVIALRARGLAIDVFAAKAPGAGVFDPDFDNARRNALYLPRALSMRAVATTLVWLVRRPVRGAATLMRCLGGRYSDDALRCRVRAVGHFVVGTALATELSRRGGYMRIHAQFFDAASTAAYVASRLLDVPLSVASHTAYNPYQLEAKCAHADRIVSISEFDRARLAAPGGAPAHVAKLVISRVGIRVEDWSGIVRRPEPARILVVGALREKKGHAILVRAASRLKARGIPARLVFVGDGAEGNRLRTLVAESGIDVEFLGALPPAAVREQLSRAAVFCLPCVVAMNGDLDGIPVALMEAMAAGVPVVSTCVSGVPELVRDGVTGRLATPGDDESLAAALAAVLADSALADRMAATARIAVSSRHDLRHTSAGLAAILSGSAP